MPRDELLSRMSSAEITDWLAELRIRNHERESAKKRAKLAAEIKGRKIGLSR